MTAAEKQAILDKIAELRAVIRDSLPIRATGGSHVYNELGKLESQVQAIVVA